MPLRHFLENIKTRLSNQSVGLYLAITFSALCVLLTLILAEVIGAAATDQIKTNIGFGLAQLARHTSDELDHGMFERYREVRLMAQRTDLSEATQTERRRILELLRHTYPHYAWIGMANTKGEVLVSAQGLLEGVDVSGRPWFKDALRGVYLHDVHEALLLSKSLGEQKRFVDIAFPYTDERGNTQGVLGAHLSWQWATEVQRSVIGPSIARYNVKSLIVDKTGKVLLGPPSLLDSRISSSSLEKARKEGSGFTTEFWPGHGEFLVGYSRGNGYREYPGLGWTVLVLQNVDDAFTPVRSIQSRVLWSGAVLAILFSLIGLLAARYITQPLTSLARHAQNAQQLQSFFNQPVATTYFEARALGESLRALVTGLLIKESELRELNQSLEHRVEHRTQALRMALANVRDSEQRIQSIIETSNDAFVSVEQNGRITGWNSSAERMFGWSREEATGKFVTDLFLPERYRALYEDAMNRFYTDGDSELLYRRFEVNLRKRTGDDIPVDMVLGLARHGDTYHFSAFLHDVSERKEIERMKTEFVSTISHELRTPLTSIRASLGMLSDGMAGELPPDVKLLIDIAYKNCERLVRLINDILDTEKIASGKMELALLRQNLAPIVQQAIEALHGYADEFKVEILLHTQEHDLPVVGDHDRIVQVIVNLVSNAVKFSPSGGKVHVRVHREANLARVSVIDRGPGIPEEFKGQIFQKFAQADATDSRQKGGTGLGLNICKYIAEKHGGTIRFHSVVGSGSEFCFELPLALPHSVGAVPAK